MAHKLQFVVDLPLAATGLVDSREVKVTVGETATVTYSLAPSSVLVEGLTGSANDPVFVSLVDVDASGNRSDPSELSAVLIDTIAPPTPGVLSLRVVGEIGEEPVVEEPVVEEPVVEEPIEEDTPEGE